MENLIEGLTILNKYIGVQVSAYAASHEILYIFVEPSKVPQDVIEDLEAIDFYIDEENNCFYTYA